MNSPVWEGPNQVCSRAHPVRKFRGGSRGNWRGIRKTEAWDLGAPDWRARSQVPSPKSQFKPWSVPDPSLEGSKGAQNNNQRSVPNSVPRKENGGLSLGCPLGARALPEVMGAGVVCPQKLFPHVGGAFLAVSVAESPARDRPLFLNQQGESAVGAGLWFQEPSTG
jgi:hypothetical protein